MSSCPVLAESPPLWKRKVGWGGRARFPLMAWGLTLWFGTVDPLPAQQVAPSLGAEGRVGGHVGASLGVATLNGAVQPQASFRAGLDLLPWLRVGGEGVFFLRAARLDPGSRTDPTELRLSYGGIYLEAAPPGDSDWQQWSSALLLASGTARSVLAELETQLESRNLLLVEPSLARRFFPGGRWSAEGRLAYRFPLTTQTVVGMSPGDLAGVSLRFTLFLVQPP